MIAENAQLASLELDKLLTFVNQERSITTEDVELLSPYHGQSDVFAMVDAIGNRQPKQASLLLHRMLEERDTLFAFAMILRQFRILTQIRESLDRGLSPQQTLHEPPFVVKRMIPQARHFSLEELESIMHQLLEIDLASKSGRGNLDTSLYKLTAALTG